MDTSLDVAGICVGMLPVTDLSRSARWYQQLLGLRYDREFADGDLVTGCALYAPEGTWGISFRLRDTIPGRPDPRGEHPLALRVPDLAALDRLQARADALGLAPLRGRHGDGEWLRVVDPDGIVLVLIVPAPDLTRRFLGVRVAEGREDGYYDAPLLDVAPVA
jgi:catechol 2,3-dioxygenase-like lactoylglutathione lyase family enzyme